jgi:glycosyltransferase involved in cell wall biosynthesis
MRIVYIAYGLISPTKAHNLQTVHTVDALVARGHGVTFINPCLPPDRAVPAAERHLPNCPTVLLRAGRRFELHRRVTAKGRFWSLFLDRSIYALRTLRHVRAARPDVVVTRDLVVCFWLLAAQFVTRAAVGYEAHTLEQVMFDSPDEPAPNDDRARRLGALIATDFAGHQDDTSWPGRMYKRFIRAVENRTIQRAHVVMTLTGGMADRLAADLNIRRPRRVPSGQAFPFPSPVDKARRRAELGLPLDRKIAVYTGLSLHGKGFESVFAVARHLPPDCLIVVLGADARICRGLAALRDEWGLRRQLAFVPRVDHDRVRAYLEAADIGLLLYPATQYLAQFSSPLKLVEYLACGLPVVATRLPSIEEAIDDGVNARLVAPGDPEAAAAVIASTVRDPVRLDRLSAGALRAAADYTYARRAERIEEALRDHLDCRRVRGGELCAST